MPEPHDEPTLDPIIRVERIELSDRTRKDLTTSVHTLGGRRSRDALKELALAGDEEEEGQE